MHAEKLTYQVSDVILCSLREIIQGIEGINYQNNCSGFVASYPYDTVLLSRLLLRILAHSHTHVHILAHTHTRTHTHTHTHTRTRTRTCTHTHAYATLCTHTTHTCIRTYEHTHSEPYRLVIICSNEDADKSSIVLRLQSLQRPFTCQYVSSDFQEYLTSQFTSGEDGLSGVLMASSVDSDK